MLALRLWQNFSLIPVGIDAYKDSDDKLVELNKVYKKILLFLNVYPTRYQNVRCSEELFEKEVYT